MAAHCYAAANVKFATSANENIVSEDQGGPWLPNSFELEVGIAFDDASSTKRHLVRPSYVQLGQERTGSYVKSEKSPIESPRNGLKVVSASVPEPEERLGKEFSITGVWRRRFDG